MKSIYILTIILSKVLNLSSAFKYATCDTINHSMCVVEESLECKNFPNSCIGGFQKWENYTKNIIEIEFNPKSNLDISFKSKIGSSNRKFTVEASARHCKFRECTAHFTDFETKFTSDFEKGKKQLNFFIETFYFSLYTYLKLIEKEDLRINRDSEN